MLDFIAKWFYSNSGCPLPAVLQLFSIRLMVLFRMLYLPGMFIFLVEMVRGCQMFAYNFNVVFFFHRMYSYSHDLSLYLQEKYNLKFLKFRISYSLCTDVDASSLFCLSIPSSNLYPYHHSQAWTILVQLYPFLSFC